MYPSKNYLFWSVACAAEAAGHLALWICFLFSQIQFPHGLSITCGSPVPSSFTSLKLEGFSRQSESWVLSWQPLTIHYPTIRVPDSWLTFNFLSLRDYYLLIFQSMVLNWFGSSKVISWSRHQIFVIPPTSNFRHTSNDFLKKLDSCKCNISAFNII